MKKIMSLIIVIILLVLTNVFANDFRYTSGSEYRSNDLGYLDYFPEVGFKNYLYNEGYTKVYDFKPGNVDVTPVGYYGLTAHPQWFDTDYVLTSEWKKYSSQYQNVRIRKNRKLIKKETKQRISYDNYLSSRINANNHKISENSTRIKNLEKTQYIVGIRVRLYDSKKWIISSFADYSTTRNKFDRVGIRITYKIGKSYEEKRIEKLEKLVKKLISEKNH